MESIDLVRGYIESKEDFPIKSNLIDVKVLSGGLVNYVYRLFFEDNTIVVLKYYPAYISANRDMKMSQKRYFVEKMALKLLSTNIELINSTIVRVPKLIYSDDAAHMLVMQYAGQNAIPLFEFLKLNNNSSDQDLAKRDELINEIANELFKFSDFLSNKSRITYQTHQDPFVNEASSVWNTLNENMQMLYKKQAKLFQIENEIEPYLIEANNFEDERKQHPQNDVFVFGDLWPNSILIDQDKKLIWIIDWEMARFDTKLKDLDQFMCNLWIMKQNPNLFDVNVIDKLMKRLQLEFFQNENVDWRTKCGKSSFVLWVITLVIEKHWQLGEETKNTVLRALDEIRHLN